MAIIPVELLEESQSRYLTYALSVVNSRALPDVRDGLKPVQRRILYAMAKNLHLTPDKHHRKSAAVVGEVLARYHPHGDSACYDALVRMAQDFSLRYPLIDGQGNFGSLDGDSAAAYRYTEAKLRPLALEVIGDIGQETVAERDNFDQTVQEPVVLPSRVPNLLMNGASGIAVGMATAIPPHNLNELVKGLLLLIENVKTTDAKIFSEIKGPDFPTGCSILNSKAELKEIYTKGRGPIRMRADHVIEEGKRGKQYVVITSIPYGIDKSVLVEKIADFIVAKKVPQLTDIRDESTDEIRIVLEIASGKRPERALAYLYKHTTLEHNFNVNLTALIPTTNPYSGKPVLLSLREMLEHFIEFRVEVTRCKLEFEKKKLQERIHLLEGLMTIIDVIDKVIKIIRKSSGRQDAAAQLQKKFKLSEIQAFYIVDLRLHQLSKTSVDEVAAELKDKQKRVREINRILKSEKALKGEVSKDLQRIVEEYGDERRSKIVHSVDEPEFDEEHYVEHEEVYVIVTNDGWMKRIRQTNDPSTTRLREGDSLAFVSAASTKDSLAIFSSKGNVFVCRILDLVSTSGYGEPVQKRYRFQDDEQIVSCRLVPQLGEDLFEKEKELFFFSERGFGFRMKSEVLVETKKIGKRLVRLGAGDALVGVCDVDSKFAVLVSEQGYGLAFDVKEVPVLSNAGKGVILQKCPKDNRVVLGEIIGKKEAILVELTKGKHKDLDLSDFPLGKRARRGNKVVKRGLPVLGLKPVLVEE